MIALIAVVCRPHDPPCDLLFYLLELSDGMLKGLATLKIPKNSRSKPVIAFKVKISKTCCLTGV